MVLYTLSLGGSRSCLRAVENGEEAAREGGKRSFSFVGATAAVVMADAAALVRNSLRRVGGRWMWVMSKSGGGGRGRKDACTRVGAYSG